MAALVQPFRQIMLALIFISAGVGKKPDLPGRVLIWEAMGVPSALLWPNLLYWEIWAYCDGDRL